MALLGVESFDVGGTNIANLPQRGWQRVGSGGSEAIGGGRTGNCLQFSGVNTYGRQLNLPSAVTTLTVGFAWATSNATGQYVLTLGGTGPSTILSYNGAVLSFSWGGATFPYIATTGFIYIELTVILAVGGCTSSLAINGNTITSPTLAGSAGTITSLTFGNGANGGSYGGTLWDDLYYRNDTTQYGPVSIPAIHPNNNGAFSQFTNSNGSQVNNYSFVNGSALQTTTFVQSTVTGQIDSYTVGPLPEVVGTGTIKGVQVTCLGAEVGVAQLAPLVISGGVTSVAALQNLALSANYLTGIWETDPNTSAAWGMSAVNNMQIGMKSSM